MYRFQFYALKVKETAKLFESFICIICLSFLIIEMLIIEAELFELKKRKRKNGWCQYRCFQVFIPFLLLFIKISGYNDRASHFI
jgi:hypothetical protein